jgi:hypothetical protein
MCSLYVTGACDEACPCWTYLKADAEMHARHNLRCPDGGKVQVLITLQPGTHYSAGYSSRSVGLFEFQGRKRPYSSSRLFSDAMSSLT